MYLVQVIRHNIKSRDDTHGYIFLPNSFFILISASFLAISSLLSYNFFPLPIPKVIFKKLPEKYKSIGIRE